MHSILSRFKGPLAAAALVFTVGTASAVEYYSYSRSSACSPCSAPVAPVVVPAPARQVCNPCSSGPAASNLPGWYSNDYNYTTSSQVDTGITYVIPQRNGGYIESHTIPLTNEVDQYYATHEVVNGQVVATGLPSNTNRSIAVYDENGNMIRSYDQNNAYARNSSANDRRNTMQSGMNQSAQTSALQPLPNLNQTRATMTAPALNDSRLNQTRDSMIRSQNAAQDSIMRQNAANRMNQTQDPVLHQNAVNRLNQTQEAVNRQNAMNRMNQNQDMFERQNTMNRMNQTQDSINRQNAISQTQKNINAASTSLDKALDKTVNNPVRTDSSYNIYDDILSRDSSY